MAKYRFVDPSDVVRLELDEGDYVVIKRYLSHGEEQAITGGMFGKVNMRSMADGNQEVPIDIGEYNIRRMLVWLVEWSFVDRKNKVVPITMDALRQLHPAVASLIQEKIDELQQAVDDQKKAMIGVALPKDT